MIHVQSSANEAGGASFGCGYLAALAGCKYDEAPQLIASGLEGVLIGFKDEDDGFEYRLEHHPVFLRRVSEARQELRDGRGVRLDEIAPVL